MGRLFIVTLQTSMRQTFAQRGGLVVAGGFYLLVTAVLAGVWRVAASSHDNNIVGYSVVAITWYIAMSEAVTIPLNMRMIADIGGDIASGSMATELLRPVSVVGVRVITEIGRAIPKLMLCLSLGALLSAWTGGAPEHAWALALAVPSALLAIACNIVAQHAFAAVAFWLRDAGSAWFLYQKLVFILGGMLIPLQAMPTWLQSTTRVLPFRAMAYAPARLASGHFEPLILVEQVAWFAALTALAAAVFAQGERRLQVVGG
jgi:ABC-2 type transport system permease protein